MTSSVYCVCGGGSLAHALVAVLGANPRVEVRVLTRRPDDWASVVEADVLGEGVVRGRVARATADAAEATRGADVVLVAVPAVARREVLTRLRPHLAPEAWVGGLPGFGGFAWQVRQVLGRAQPVFGFQRVPFVCRKTAYGKRVEITGIRPRHYVASVPRRRIGELCRRFRDDMNLYVVGIGNYLNVEFSRSNSLFHPPRVYSLFREWTPGTVLSLPLDLKFYEDWDEHASEIFLRLDEEVQAATRLIPLDLGWAVPVLQHYEVPFPEDLTPKIRAIRALAGRPVPLRQVPGGTIPDLKAYYFSEDVSYGLVVLKAILELTEAPTPYLDRVLDWGQRLLGLDLLMDGRVRGRDAAGIATPQNSGIGDLEALRNFCSE